MKCLYYRSVESSEPKDQMQAKHTPCPVLCFVKSQSSSATVTALVCILFQCSNSMTLLTPSRSHPSSPGSDSHPTTKPRHPNPAAYCGSSGKNPSQSAQNILIPTSFRILQSREQLPKPTQPIYKSSLPQIQQWGTTHHKSSLPLPRLSYGARRP